MSFFDNIVIRRPLICAALLALAVSCRIPNDFPYPHVEAEITAFEVECMCSETGFSDGSAVIDKAARTVTLYVNDLVDLSKVKITRFEVSKDAKIIADSHACLYPARFPDSSFQNNDSDRTMTDFTGEVHFTLRTYQDYVWTVKVKQVVLREIQIEGQVGNAVIDTFSRKVVVYVSSDRDFSALKVRKFTLGGQNGKVVPDPNAVPTYDFRELPTKFFVKHGWQDFSYEWSVFVYPTDAKTSLTAEVFPRTVDAIVSGTKPSEETLLLEYCKSGTSEWSVVPASQIDVNGIHYSARITGLEAGTSYSWRATAEDQHTEEAVFTTTQALQLQNPSLDDWHLEGTALYNPWAEGGESFWDTGNRGATTVGASNSVPSDESSTGSGKSAVLQSKFIVIKFAAGNIFTGRYVKTDGSNGVLDFGRPFSAFPSAMSFDYKYRTSLINRIGSADYSHLKGTPDECQIYIALTDWDEPFRVRTKPSDLSLFDKNDPHVIAYGELISGQDQTEWKTHTIQLNYRDNKRTPKYILVVCSSSRYGDFFTGGDSSVLQLDNFNLIYE